MVQRQSHSRSTIPCPKCHRIIKAGDTFCGFCREPQLVQCANCGQWNAAKHEYCTGCGSPLSQGGLSFVQREHLAALRQQRTAIKAERTLCQKRLKELSVQQRQAYLRAALVVGLLACAGAILAVLFKGITSTLTGMVILGIMLWIFRFKIPGFLASILRRIGSWVFPDLMQVRQAIAREERALADLEQDMHQVKREIAALKQAAQQQQTTQLHVLGKDDEPDEEVEEA